MITAIIEVKGSVKKKLNSNTMKRVMHQSFDEFSEDVYWNIMDSGIGVAGGNTPTKGSPVYQKPKFSHQPPAGSLLRSHFLEKNGNINYIKGGVYDNGYNYLNAVINGTSKFPANPYHKRSIDKSKRNMVLSNSFKKSFINELGS